MATRKDILEFLSNHLLQSQGLPRAELNFHDDLRSKLGLTDATIVAIGQDANRQFRISLLPSEIVKSRTVNDLVDIIFSATQRGIAASIPGGQDESASIRGIHDEDNIRRISSKVDAEYVVWYGTNRKQIGADKAAVTYSAQRGQATSLGRCRVFIPRGHKMGSTGSSWWKRLVILDDRLRVLETEFLDEQAYWTSLQAKLSRVSDDDRSAVVFIHGYNVSFEGAAIRAAQIGFDLSIKGAMAFFSWPSQGELSGYLTDGAAIEASEDAIANFLVDFASRSGAKSVHVIAHSMGNRGLLRAVDRIVGRAGASGAAIFSQIILAAPDVDAGLFRGLCKAYGSAGERTTLYVSNKDLAVEAASWVYDFARAGFAPPIFVAPGIDTINVTNVDVSRLGHGYVAEARDVLMDIFRLIGDGAEPAKRNLAQLNDESGSIYWEFKK
jgi:esterase/lipase superfamily enzyme